MQSDQNSILATQIGVPFCDQRNWLHWEIYFGSPTLMRNNRFRPGSGYEVVAWHLILFNWQHHGNPKIPWFLGGYCSPIFWWAYNLHGFHGFFGVQRYIYIYIHISLIYTIGRYYFTSQGRLPINQEADKSIDISAASQCTVNIAIFHVWMIFVTKNHPEKVVW